MLNVFQRLAQHLGRITEKAQADVAGVTQQRPNLAGLVTVVYRKHRRVAAQHLAFNPAADSAHAALRVVHALVLFKRDAKLAFDCVALARQRFGFLAPAGRSGALRRHVADLAGLAPRLRPPVLVAVETVNRLCLSAARAGFLFHDILHLWLHYAELYHSVIVNASDSYEE